MPRGSSKHWTRAQWKEYRDHNKVTIAIRNRRYSLKKSYGMTEVCYSKMLREQKHRCKICRIHKSKLKGKLHVDHCHKSNKVRALLCANCNHLLGKAKDRVEILETAILYLEHFKGNK